jgi:hypothetical protein
VLIGAFIAQYVNQTLLAFLGNNIFNDPINNLGDQLHVQLLSDFSLATYNYLIFGVVLAIMMIKRPEGLFPDEAAKAEMHGIGVAAEVTAGSADLLAAAEETESVALEAAPIEEATEIPESLSDNLVDTVRADEEEPPR